MKLHLERDPFEKETDGWKDKLKSVGASISEGLDKLGKEVNKGLDKFEKTLKEVGNGMSDDLVKLGKSVNKHLDKIAPPVSNVGKSTTRPSETLTKTTRSELSKVSSVSQTYYATAGLNEYVSEVKVKSVSQDICVDLSKACEIFKVLKQHDFPKSELGNLTKDDYAAISYCISAQHITKIRWGLYCNLPSAVSRRMTFWLLQGCSTIEGADYYGPDRLGAILKHYTLVSSHPLPEKIAWGIRLAKIAILFLTGIALPQVRTLYLGTIWCKMGIEMLKGSKYDSAGLGGAIISMFCGLIPSLAKEEMQGMTLLFCNDGEGNWNKLSFEARKFWGKLTKDQNLDETKFAAWNKTLGVLIRNEKLSINGSSRMLSTYSMGTSFIRSICCNGNIQTFVNGISPLPSSYAINNLIKLFRSEKDYTNRRNSIIYNQLESIQNPEIRMRHVAPVYRELLKLKYAYLPVESHSVLGTFYTANSIGRDYSLISEIANKFRANNRDTLIEYIISLIQDMEKNDAGYLEFFGDRIQNSRTGRLYGPKLTHNQKKHLKSVTSTVLIVGAAIAVGEILEGNLDTEDVIAEGVDTYQADVYSGYINEEELMRDFNPEDIGVINSGYTPESFEVSNNGFDISFKGSNDTVTFHQEGNSLKKIVLNVEKVPGTSHQWYVKKGSKIIAIIDSLTNAKISIPGFGTGVL